MNTTFEERLKRIGHARDPVDMIGQGNKRDNAPLPTLSEPTTFDQSFRKRVLMNAGLGFFWMLPTAWLMTDPPRMREILASWYETAAEAAYAADMIRYGAMVSFILYIAYTRSVHAVSHPSERGVGFSALMIGGFIGIILGFIAAFGVEGFIEELGKGSFED